MPGAPHRPRKGCQFYRFNTWVTPSTKSTEIPSELERPSPLSVQSRPFPKHRRHAFPDYCAHAGLTKPRRIRELTTLRIFGTKSHTISRPAVHPTPFTRGSPQSDRRVGQLIVIMCFGSRKKEEADATRSRELDKIIKADEKRMAKEVKLLLLGEAASYSPP